MIARSAEAILASRAGSGARAPEQITPCARTLWRRPSVSMTPHPVRSVPQSIPNTRTAVGRRSGQRFHLLFVDIEVGIDILNVVMLFEDFAQLQHAAGVLSFELDEVLRDHSDFSRSGGNARFMHGVENFLMQLGSRNDLPVAAIVAQIVGPGFEHQIHQLVLRGLVSLDDDVAFAFKHPGNTSLLGEVPAEQGRKMANLAHGAVAVIRGHLRSEEHTSELQSPYVISYA